MKYQRPKFNEDVFREHEEDVERCNTKISDIQRALQDNPMYDALLVTEKELRDAEYRLRNNSYLESKINERIEEFSKNHTPEIIFKMDRRFGEGSNHPEHHFRELIDYRNPDGRSIGIYGLKHLERCPCGFDKSLNVFQLREGNTIQELKEGLEQRKWFYLPKDKVELLFTLSCAQRDGYIDRDDERIFHLISKL